MFDFVHAAEMLRLLHFGILFGDVIVPNHMIYDHFTAKDGDGKEHQNDKDSFERFHGVMMYGLWGRLNYRSPASPFRG